MTMKIVLLILTQFVAEQEYLKFKNLKLLFDIYFSEKHLSSLTNFTNSFLIFFFEGEMSITIERDWII